MMDFVGREKELRCLESMFNDTKFRACAIIGRRRIGKTMLLKKFIEDKKAVYIQFMRSSLETNLIKFSIAMSYYLGVERKYVNVLEFFKDLSSMAKKERHVIVFDEYPFLCDTDGMFSSIVQDFIDNEIRDSFLIISGSSVAMLEEETSSYGRPLYGRMRKLYLDPMSFGEAKIFHPNLCDMDSLKLYLITGGVPFYLHDTPAKSFGEYLDRYVLPERSLFHEEGESIFNREFSSPDYLISVMDALGNGCNEIKSISDFTGIDRMTCSRLISTLIGMKYVSAIVPMLGAPVKPVRYEITDPFLSFQFCVLRKMSVRSEPTYESISPLVSTHLGRAFESFCSEYLRINHCIQRIGRWWGAIVGRDDFGNVLRREDGKPETEIVEIDIVADAVIDDNRVMMFSECKFHNMKVGEETLRSFRTKVEKISRDTNYRLMFFSISGFTDNAVDYSKSENIQLIGPELLFAGCSGCIR